ncbi:hypothetical protein BH11ACT8_BH11ACT8_07510 [soil metagenome]
MWHHDDYGSSMMDGGGGWMILMVVLLLLLVAAGIFASHLLLQASLRRTAPGAMAPGPDAVRPVLDARLARGDITLEEYDALLARLKS